MKHVIVTETIIRNTYFVEAVTESEAIQEVMYEGGVRPAHTSENTGYQTLGISLGCELFYRSTFCLFSCAA